MTGLFIVFAIVLILIFLGYRNTAVGLTLINLLMGLLMFIHYIDTPTGIIL